MSNQLENISLSSRVESIGWQVFLYNQLISVIVPSSVTIQGKSSSVDFESYPTSSPWGWGDGYSDSNIIWNG